MSDEECPPISISEQKSRLIMVTKYLPVFGWLPQYTRFKAASDLIAGITLGLTVIPQSMAYAMLAERIPQYGLYSCFVGGFLYIILGTTKEVSIGPSSLMSLLTLQYTRNMPQDFVILLCFLTGCVEFLMGVLNLGLILKLKDINYPCMRNKKDASKKAMIKKILWYFSIGRNALIVLITSTIAYQFEANTGAIPFSLSGKIEAGIPKLSLPPFSSQVGNQTYTFLDMCTHYGLGLGILPIIAVSVNVAIAKAFAMDSSINATQEMLALGLCNILGSFVSSLPTSGAFTRSGVGSASGVQTSMAGLYSGTMALLALSFLTPYFYYIPRATLSAVLISAVLPMIDLKIIKVFWKGNSKTDAIAATGTFVISILIGIEIGLLLGVLFNLIIFIRFFTKLTFQTNNCKTHLGNKYIMLKFNTCFHYPSATSFCDKVINLATNNVPLIINCKTFTSLDYTSIKAIETLSKRLNHKKNQFWLLDLNSDIVKNFDVFADDKYIRLIEKEEDIANVLYDDALSNLNSENLINITTNSRREDSESNAEELTLMSTFECKLVQQ
ncbi:Sodium-independent sulfate anion transporter [Cyphomyrmex costatus]|uniref:Sodium-independent sulfate anion transporter n=1 Tax=Cyphomyrmex costatus TaxID=456900 RepID=A0A195CZZ1_9HYME|nr:Sodium-independent sulfate anion transporter [Cyphomyrmex costatus]